MSRRARASCLSDMAGRGKYWRAAYSVRSSGGSRNACYHQTYLAIAPRRRPDRWTLRDGVPGRAPGYAARHRRPERGGLVSPRAAHLRGAVRSDVAQSSRLQIRVTGQLHEPVRQHPPLRRAKRRQYRPDGGPMRGRKADLRRLVRQVFGRPARLQIYVEEELRQAPWRRCPLHRESAAAAIAHRPQRSALCVKQEKPQPAQWRAGVMSGAARQTENRTACGTHIPAKI
jgi:hypothetical protein